MPPKTVKKRLSKKKKIGLSKKDTPSVEQKGLELQQQQQQLQLQRLQQQQQQQQQQLQQQPQINQWFQNLNQSKYFAGVIMILMNMGSRFISLELSERHENILGHPMVRRLMLFTVFFTATRDVWISILLTAAFVILVTGVFHDNSRFCLIPKKYRQSKKTVSREDVQKAQKVLELAKQQEQSEAAEQKKDKGKPGKVGKNGNGRGNVNGNGGVGGGGGGVSKNGVKGRGGGKRDIYLENLHHFRNYRRNKKTVI